MNWRNVIRLLSVDVKASRTLRGIEYRKFMENRLVVYALYISACFFGFLLGWFIGNFYLGITEPSLKQLMLEGAKNLFVSLPTLALIYGLVFTQMGRFQRVGANVSAQPLYWFPITWEEYTLASVLANLIHGPLLITVFICFSILTASVFLGLVPLAVLTLFTLFCTIILASITTEIPNVLLLRVSRTVAKVAGRRAVWIRFFGTVIFLVIFYFAYFTIVSGTSFPILIESLVTAQKLLWFIPYLWFSIGLSAFVSGLSFVAILFFSAALVFTYGLYWVAVRLNSKYGLSEMPSITISRGVYAPKTGRLEKLGFSLIEAAVIKKDFKAFTRRGELMYIFIVPVVVIIAPLMSLMSGTGGPVSPFVTVYLMLIPGTLMAVTIGSIVTGSEGASVWFVYASPLSARSLVKAKYFFTVFFSLAVAVVCSFVGFLLYPSLKMVFIGLTEAALLVLSTAMVSLSFGIKGADFRELPPRPRMVKPFWSFINMIVSFVLALVVVSPLIPYGFKILAEEIPFGVIISLPEVYLYAALLLSAVIAFAIAYFFGRIAVKNAEELLARAAEK